MDVSTADPFLGFTGCNATLQWDMTNSSYEQEQTDIRIINNAGDVIATNSNNQCMIKNNLPMSCLLSQKNDDLNILLTLMKITTNHSGNYTAWFKEELNFKIKTRSLIVIDKPRITELQKPVLNQIFTVTCTTSYTSDCITYCWKINGSDVQKSINIHATMSTLTYRNVTMMDNFSTLTCRAKLEKCRNILCISSEDSDPYTVKPYYGPLYVYLDLNESLVYLEENIAFKVKCSASCYPYCTFRWESYYINVDNEELVIHNFKERLSGQYTCTARNRETGVTANSFPLYLHQAKELSTVFLGVGLVIVAICLIIVGALIFVIQRRKCDSTRLVSLAVNQTCARPTNRETTQDFLPFQKKDRPLPTPAVPDISYRILRRSCYPKINRKSLSLHSIVNHDQTLWRPIRQSLSLQSLLELSHDIGRLDNNDNSQCQPFCTPKGGKNGIRPDTLYLNAKKHTNVGSNGQNPDAIPQSFAQEQQELYSTIEETSCSEYEYFRVNMQVERQDNQRNTDAGNYDYDYAFLPQL
ncbi:hypothetical protein ACJMK2_026338 [Sinanodonta woodiana]|uniref:Ig-like domain-containing protein n=1 Tax=Sinanodonta woodiana TaxID=1069815 RepID=A0ABD3XLK4_SINWO